MAITNRILVSGDTLMRTRSNNNSTGATQYRLGAFSGGGRVRGRQFGVGGKMTPSTRGQGSHGHQINTGYLQNWMTNHQHYTNSSNAGLTTGGAMFDGNGYPQDGDYFDDDVGFAYTESGGGGHMGHRNFMKRGGKVRGRRFGQGGRTRTGVSRSRGQGSHSHFIPPEIVTQHTHLGHVPDQAGDSDIWFAGEVYEQPDSTDGNWQIDGWNISDGGHMGHRNFMKRGGRVRSSRMRRR